MDDEHIKKQIPFENPIPLSDKRTIDKFNQVLAKARMMYTIVAVHNKYQFALLTNLIDKKAYGEFNIIYTSEKDGEVHTVETGLTNEDYDIESVAFTGNGIKFTWTERKYIDQSKYEYLYRNELIAPNGRVLIPRGLYKAITEVGQSLLLADPLDNDMGAVMYDYNGNLWVDKVIEGLVLAEKQVKIGNGYADILMYPDIDTLTRRHKIQLFAVCNDGVYAIYKDNDFIIEPEDIGDSWVDLFVGSGYIDITIEGQTYKYLDPNEIPKIWKKMTPIKWEESQLSKAY